MNQKQLDKLVKDALEEHHKYPPTPKQYKRTEVRKVLNEPVIRIYYRKKLIKEVEL